MTLHSVDESEFSDYFVYLKHVQTLLERAQAISLDHIKQITQMVLSLFVPTSKVSLIYRGFENHCLTFWIFTDEQTYDNVLMDTNILANFEKWHEKA